MKNRAVRLTTLLGLSFFSLAVICASALGGDITGTSGSVIFQDDFESQDPNCWKNRPNSGGWNFAGCGGFVDIGKGSNVALSVGEVSHSGTKAMKITFTYDEDYGGAEVSLAGKHHLFTRRYDYYTTSFDFAYGMKIHRLRAFNGSINDFDIVSIAWGKPTSGWADMSGINDMTSISINANGGPVDWGSASSGFSFQRNKWYCVETEVKLNDPGLSNGEVRIWIDEKLLVARTNINIRSSLSKGINRVMFGGWYSNGAAGQNPQPNPAVPSIRYIDDVVVSTARVGCLPNTLDKSPPSPPTGLRVQ